MTNAKCIYLIGSLRNPKIPVIATSLRDSSTEVFDNWFSAGVIADDAWRDYERGRGHDYQTALRNHSAKNVFAFDHFHMNRSHAAVLSLPAGRSGHLEAGYMSGQGKPVFLLLDEEKEPDRLDVMNQFLYGVYRTMDDLKKAIKEFPWPQIPSIPSVVIADAQWLSGILEGSGTFYLAGDSPRMVLQLEDADVVERAASILGSKVWSTKKEGKQVWACGASALTAVEWMRILRPFMGMKRQEQISATVRGWLNKREHPKADRNWWTRVFSL